MSGLLILVRHGQSTGNLRNIFTGRLDPPLTEKGRQEARDVGLRLRELAAGPTVIYTSTLARAKETAEIVAASLAAPPPILSEPALDERDYGALTGMNKDEAAKLYGADRIRIWRRSYRQHPPSGENLLETRRRVAELFYRSIAQKLWRHDTVLVVAHGNSLRALVMEVAGLSEQEIERFEIATGQILVYDVDFTPQGLRAVARCRPSEGVA